MNQKAVALTAVYLTQISVFLKVRNTTLNYVDFIFTCEKQNKPVRVTQTYFISSIATQTTKTKAQFIWYSTVYHLVHLGTPRCIKVHGCTNTSCTTRA